MPKVFSKPTKRVTASDTDSNKENIPPSSFTATLSPITEEPSHIAATVFLNQNFPPPQPNAFHLPDIISHFDQAFPNHTSYRQYVTYSLRKWASDPPFHSIRYRLLPPSIGGTSDRPNLSHGRDAPTNYQKPTKIGPSPATKYRTTSIPNGIQRTWRPN